MSIFIVDEIGLDYMNTVTIISWNRVNIDLQYILGHIVFSLRLFGLLQECVHDFHHP